MGVTPSEIDSSNDDGTFDRALILDEHELNKKNELTLINTNARSLAPKVDSLIDCFTELDVDIAVVTETWFREGDDLREDLRELELGTDIASITRCRDPNASTGVAHGGVAIMYKKRIGTFKEISITNPEKYEVLPAIGTLRGSSRKMLVIAAYIPPNYSTARAAGCVQFIEDLLVEMKQRFRDPFIVLAGDFNQGQVQEAVEEFADVAETLVGPTRDGRSIDRIFTNMSRSVKSAGTVPPLETDHSKSDHLVAYVTLELPRKESFEWVTFSYRFFTEEARAEFG